MEGRHVARVRRTESDKRAIMERLARSGRAQEAFCREEGRSSRSLS